jgi:hypothetical protein
MVTDGNSVEISTRNVRKIHKNLYKQRVVIGFIYFRIKTMARF